MVEIHVVAVGRGANTANMKKTFLTFSERRSVVYRCVHDCRGTRTALNEQREYAFRGYVHKRLCTFTVHVRSCTFMYVFHKVHRMRVFPE